MNGYLVVLRHSMDDIPLLLTADRDEAWKFAQAVKEDDGESEKQVLSLDASTPICVTVYTFENGKLTAADLANDFEDGDESSEKVKVRIAE